MISDKTTNKAMLTKTQDNGISTDRMKRVSIQLTKLYDVNYDKFQIVTWEPFLSLRCVRSYIDTRRRLHSHYVHAFSLRCISTKKRTSRKGSPCRFQGTTNRTSIHLHINIHYFWKIIVPLSITIPSQLWWRLFCVFAVRLQRIWKYQRRPPPHVPQFQILQTNPFSWREKAYNLLRADFQMSHCVSHTGTIENLITCETTKSHHRTSNIEPSSIEHRTSSIMSVVPVFAGIKINR